MAIPSKIQDILSSIVVKTKEFSLVQFKQIDSIYKKFFYDSASHADTEKERKESVQTEKSEDQKKTEKKVAEVGPEILLNEKNKKEDGESLASPPSSEEKEILKDLTSSKKEDPTSEVMSSDSSDDDDYKIFSDENSDDDDFDFDDDFDDMDDKLEFKESLFEESSKKTSEVSGIRNIGNFCYGNSTIQPLFNHPKIQEYFDLHPEEFANDIYPEDFIFGEATYKFLGTWEKKYKTLKPQEKKEYLEEYKKIILKHPFIWCFQGKVRKYFSRDFTLFLSKMQDELAKKEQKFAYLSGSVAREEAFDFLKDWYEDYKKGSTSEKNAAWATKFHKYVEQAQDIQRNPWGFQDAKPVYEFVLNTIGYFLEVDVVKKSAESKIVKRDKDITNTIILPLTSGTLKLQELVDNKFAPINVNDTMLVEVTNHAVPEPSEKYEKWTTWTEETKIVTQPPSLILIQYLRYNNDGIKDSRKIDVPKDDLVKFSKAFEAPVWYRITGCTVHEGVHYTSYVKNGDKWLCCNDGSVTEVPREQVKIENAYFVVLERVDDAADAPLGS